VTGPVLVPGWYKAGEGGGLERVADLDAPPEDLPAWDLVRVEAGETMTEEPLW
jgi:hypothetical protein